MKLLLHQVHEEAGAAFEAMKGWLMPDSYGDWVNEYQAARERVAIMDTSYQGNVHMSGNDALDLLNRLSTNAVIEARPGSAVPTVLTTERGRVLDHITVYIQDSSLLLLVSPGNTEEVMHWLDKYIILEDVKLADAGAQFCILSLLGPKAAPLLQKALGIDLEASGMGQFHTSAFQSHHVWASNASLLHPAAVDIVVPAEAASSLWRHLLQEGQALGISRLGNRAYQALRIEAGVPLLGQDMGLDFNPLEAGLWGSVSFSKGCYIGQEVIARLNTYQKVKRNLRTLLLAGDIPVPPRTPLLAEGQEAGFVTSWAYSPKEKCGVALGYVNRKAEEAGYRLKISLPGQELDVKVPEKIPAQA